MSKRHFSYRRGGLSGNGMQVAGKEQLFAPAASRGPVQSPFHTTKTSQPVAGHPSPRQANQNMAGSAVKIGPGNIAKVNQFNAVRAIRVPDGVDRQAYLKMSPSEQASIRRILASDDADRRSHLRNVHGRAGKDSRGLRGASYQVGPRGGRYYISKNGKKVYVK